MNTQNPHDKLKHRVEQQAQRIHKAESERSSLLAQTVFIGTLGLLFVVPMVAGAFIGAWIDHQSSGYSASWTLNLVVLGTLLGGINVCLFIRRH
ncbi:AtpZ/AtpI family protein [Aestuariirhabdus litorea]|uniref:AtpZ/AtpI family protein n=1 Tax=Aestuariirhabdus litorea TaxID=2528527 RepID=A0A3P3VNE8_9GAMM|nr:AtpZ/AtpI family protein [Aestuariirhabdus litorea]RRJ84130.1 AtpZ/AtpI family protein [Aestuariirhabdus litorea]RWW97350.1 AtpZ/AtpI family protein [Endozoicomonadaceae bacterium GTF-13]